MPGRIPGAPGTSLGPQFSHLVKSRFLHRPTRKAQAGAWRSQGAGSSLPTVNLKTASATRLRRAALHKARNGVSHSIASCALHLGHSCDFQGTKWEASKDS